MENFWQLLLLFCIDFIGLISVGFLMLLTLNEFNDILSIIIQCNFIFLLLKFKQIRNISNSFLHIFIIWRILKRIKIIILKIIIWGNAQYIILGGRSYFRIDQLYFGEMRKILFWVVCHFSDLFKMHWQSAIYMINLRY